MKKAIALLILTIVFSASGQRPKKSVPNRGVNTENLSEVQEALQSFDLSHLSINPNNLTVRDILDLRSNFLPAVKPYLIADGELVARLARIAGPVLLYHKAGKSQIVVFDSKIPAIFTWKETFITFSSGALELLTDDEIAALVAHEIGHLYYAEALAEARAAGDDRTTRVIELECDLVAFTTLSKLDLKPPALVSAVKKLIEKRRQLQIDSFQPGSPALADREAIFNAYLKRTNDVSGRKRDGKPRKN